MSDLANLIYLSDSKLAFGGGFETLDPRDGLSLFGPRDSARGRQPRVGVIGTPTGISLYKSFVARLARPFISPKGQQRPSFPGFEAVFGIQWSPEPAYICTIDPDTLTMLLRQENLKERTSSVVMLYLNEIFKVKREEESPLDLWVIITPKQVRERCRANAPSTVNKAHQQHVKKYGGSQAGIFPKDNNYLTQLESIYDYHSDFHHQLKARLLQQNILVPTQLMREPTLGFRGGPFDNPYTPEMMAHLAWTIGSSVYYKLGYLPWKLSGIRPGVCYLGLVFKKVDNLRYKGYACSAAQMFLDSGDGTVFRGNVGPWHSEASDEFHLDKASAAEMIGMALEAYKMKHGVYPEEVFIHGRAKFSNDEWKGFAEKAGFVSPGTKLTGVVIKESDKLKLFRDTPGEACRYGNLRGLAYLQDEYEAYLWTRGFVPRLNTSMSMEIPTALRIQLDKTTGSRLIMEQVLNDILALTKLNYNACVFADGLPVTLKFSDLIGSILTAAPNINNPVLPFKYYI